MDLDFSLELDPNDLIRGNGDRARVAICHRKDMKQIERATTACASPIYKVDTHRRLRTSLSAVSIALGALLIAENAAAQSTRASQQKDTSKNY